MGTGEPQGSPVFVYVFWHVFFARKAGTSAAPVLGECSTSYNEKYIDIEKLVIKSARS